MTRYLLGVFTGLMAGGLLGALIALWAWTDAPIHNAPRYQIQRTQPRHAPEIMTQIDPCFQRMSGIDPDPCDRPRGTVPEPSTLLLALAGAGGLIWYGRRRRGVKHIIQYRRH